MPGISLVSTRLNTIGCRNKRYTAIPPSIRNMLTQNEAEMLSTVPHDTFLQLVRQTPQAVKDFLKLISGQP